MTLAEACAAVDAWAGCDMPEFGLHLIARTLRDAVPFYLLPQPPEPEPPPPPQSSWERTKQLATPGGAGDWSRYVAYESAWERANCDLPCNDIDVADLQTRLRNAEWVIFRIKGCFDD